MRAFALRNSVEKRTDKGNVNVITKTILGSASIYFYHNVLRSRGDVQVKQESLSYWSIGTLWRAADKELHHASSLFVILRGVATVPRSYFSLKKCSEACNTVGMDGLNN